MSQILEINDGLLIISHDTGTIRLEKVKKGWNITLENGKSRFLASESWKPGDQTVIGGVDLANLFVIMLNGSESSKEILILYVGVRDYGKRIDIWDTEGKKLVDFLAEPFVVPLDLAKNIIRPYAGGWQEI